MTDQAIVAEKLAFHYGDLKAVDEIDFSVAQGDIIGFLGPNGAGKTTTIKLLTGQMAAKSGKATVLNLDISKHQEEVQEQIGVCFEITNLYEQMSGVENLVLFSRLFDVKNFDADAVLKRVGLDGRGKDKVAEYSKGMKQRLMVARALINTPKILFLDEPTEGLDPVSSESIRNIIRQESERGATVFLTTHDMHEADKLSDHVAFINQGKIVALDTPHNLKQQYGKRMLLAKVKDKQGGLQDREIVMDRPETAKEVAELFESEDVVTVHSEEASLEDIFIQITGRGLMEQ